MKSLMFSKLIANFYEVIMDVLEDKQLAKIVRERAHVTSPTKGFVE